MSSENQSDVFPTEIVPFYSFCCKLLVFRECKIFMFPDMKATSSHFCLPSQAGDLSVVLGKLVEVVPKQLLWLAATCGLRLAGDVPANSP